MENLLTYDEKQSPLEHRPIYWLQDTAFEGKVLLRGRPDRGLFASWRAGVEKPFHIFTVLPPSLEQFKELLSFYVVNDNHIFPLPSCLSFKNALPHIQNVFLLRQLSERRTFEVIQVEQPSKIALATDEEVKELYAEKVRNCAVSLVDDARRRVDLYPDPNSLEDGKKMQGLLYFDRFWTPVARDVNKDVATISFEPSFLARLRHPLRRLKDWTVYIHARPWQEKNLG